LRENEPESTILMNFLKTLPPCLMQALNVELGKIKKNQKSHKEIVDLLDMSASRGKRSQSSSRSM
jgi:hypothetical protein